MVKAFTKDRKNLPSGDDADHPIRDLDTLRQIIAGEEKERVSRLEQRLDDAQTRANELSRVLPDALVLSSARDQKIARSLQPTIETAIHSSVQKNPKVLADAIFPLMGPGIRKAISATIMGMIQSFNQLLNHSFSIQGFKWRVEALRTRKPYAEIVLLHTLLYQVEQVYLIHRPSGLVLQHVVGPAVKFQDPDLVSGMLTVIEDFVHDSFNVASDNSLDTLRIGSDRSVWIEQGPKAMLAGVIRGTPPLELRHRMAEILNTIHLKYGQLLDTYEGDSVVFEDAHDDLATCLDTEFKAARKKTSPLLWIISALVLTAAASWAFVVYRNYQRSETFLEALRAQPGVIITGMKREASKVVVSGLKDPLAEDPAMLALPHAPPSGQIDYRWRPYVSLEPELILIRANRMLQPPHGVTLVLDGNTLVASGEAGHRWIRRFNDWGRTMEGINHIRADQLVDIDVQALHAVRQRIETTRILFSVRASTLPPDQVPKLNALADDLQKLVFLSKQLDHPLAIRIAGYTDNSGAEEANLKLSRDRARAVHRFLIDKGKATIAIMVVGMGARRPLDDQADENLRARSRFAGFELVNDAGFRQGND